MCRFDANLSSARKRLFSGQILARRLGGLEMTLTVLGEDGFYHCDDVLFAGGFKDRGKCIRYNKYGFVRVSGFCVRKDRKRHQVKISISLHRAGTVFHERQTPPVHLKKKYSVSSFHPQLRLPVITNYPPNRYSTPQLHLTQSLSNLPTSQQPTPTLS